jgi:hypothetical protein
LVAEVGGQDVLGKVHGRFLVEKMIWRDIRHYMSQTSTVQFL